MHRRRIATLITLTTIVIIGFYAYSEALMMEPEVVSMQIDISSAPTKGAATASVAVVEFGDYQCQYCATQANTVLRLLDRDYVNSGKIKYVFMNFPLPKHLLAPKAAQAAICAGETGKYWPMHDLIFRRGDVKLESLWGYASALGLHTDSFKACVSSGRYRGNVARDYREGVKANVWTTPTTFLGFTGLDVVQATMKFQGTVNYRSLREAVDVLLAEAKENKRAGTAPQ